MLAGIIKAYIDSSGLKYKAISEKTQISLQTLSAMLNGKRKITAEEYFAICQALNVSVDYFAKRLSASKTAEAV